MVLIVWGMFLEQPIGLGGNMKEFKSKFIKTTIKESGMDANYLTVHITNFLKQNSLSALMNAVAMALISNGFKKQADIFRKVMGKIK